jgi:hypothetical protein
MEFNPTPVTDEDLIAYSQDCKRLCAELFGRPANSLPAPFEMVYADTGPRFEMLPTGDTLVILKPGNDVWKHRFQVGHEVTHWLLTPANAAPGILHWSHEMLANTVSIRCLRGSGIPQAEQYARACERDFQNSRTDISVETLLTTELVEPYDWVFGPAFRMGQRLEKPLKWKRLKALGTTFDADGKPDVGQWVDKLDPKFQGIALKALTGDRDRWV